jgi:hypothetical protein
MTETATSTKAKTNGTKAADLSAALREEVITSVKQTQQFTLDALTTWVDAVGKLVPKPVVLPFAPPRSEVAEGVASAFEVAEELLALQRKFASEVVDLLLPAS